ncbi:hypothetical protein ACFVAJ_14220 [Agromyces sp. NPDC057679]|uniref:hypothetical protein n=1 Tax=Agromyces sp. NPDC057679 TaxID=3346207 RepID=UPI003672B7D9
MLSGTVMLESFWATDRDESHFHRGFDLLGAPRGVEIWCYTRHDLARKRFLTRERHRAHFDEARRSEWEALTSNAAPLSGLPVLPVETSTPVDVPGLAAVLRRRMAGTVGATDGERAVASS